MRDEASVAGREAELARLQALLDGAANGQGTTVFLAGEPGTGRRALVEALRSGDPPPALHTARCRAEDGQLNAYQPFAELLRELVSGDGRGARRRVGKAVLGALESSAPTWLSMVPIVGAGIGATWASVSQKLREVESSALQLGAGSVLLLAREFEQALAAALDEDGTVVLVLAQAQWVDPSSLELLAELQDFVARNRVLVIVSYRPNGVADGHPLPRRVRDLVAEGQAHLVTLAPLDRDGIRARIRARLGGLDVPDPLESWLAAYSGGNLLYLDGLLDRLTAPEHGVLRQEGDRLVLAADVMDDGGALHADALARRIALPDSIEAALDQRLEHLTDERRRLLQVAAVEGERFLVSTLVHATGLEEEAVVDALAELTRDRLVREAEADGFTFAYEFTHQLLRRRLYDSLSGAQRALRHRDVAAALEQVHGERAHRSALLDIAHHHELGGRPLEAAGYYHRAAQTASLDGAGEEARGLAETALRLVRNVLDGGAHLTDEQAVGAERLRAEAVLMVLCTLDFRWVGADRDGQQALTALYDEGLAAAREAHDQGLRARFEHMQGSIELTSGNVRRARERLEQAALLSAQAGDEVTRLAVLIDLANVVSAADLPAGKALLGEARELSARLREGASRSVMRELDRLAARLDAMTGIAESDSGQLGAALELLDASIVTLERLGHVADLPRVVNYWAQTALLACDFDAAFTRLEKVTTPTPSSPNPWNAYNRAVLGKVALDAGRPDEAAAWIDGGWEELQQAPDNALMAIVRLYVIELRLDEPGDAVDTLIAEQLETAESLQLGYAAAAARTLAAERELARGRAETALDWSKPAAALLLKSAHLPVVRSEEVFASHARCLAALGRADEAAEWRDRALEVLTAKAESLGDAAARERMLAAAPAARRLATLDASTGQAAPAASARGSEGNPGG